MCDCEQGQHTGVLPGERRSVSSFEGRRAKVQRFNELEVCNESRTTPLVQGVHDRGAGAAGTTPALQEGDLRGAELQGPLRPPYAVQVDFSLPQVLAHKNADQGKGTKQNNNKHNKNTTRKPDATGMCIFTQVGGETRNTILAFSRPFFYETRNFACSCHFFWPKRAFLRVSFTSDTRELHCHPPLPYQNHNKACFHGDTHTMCVFAHFRPKQAFFTQFWRNAHCCAFPRVLGRHALFPFFLRFPRVFWPKRASSRVFARRELHHLSPYLPYVLAPVCTLTRSAQGGRGTQTPHATPPGNAQFPIFCALAATAAAQPAGKACENACLRTNHRNFRQNSPPHCGLDFFPDFSGPLRLPSYLRDPTSGEATWPFTTSQVRNLRPH